VSQVIVITGATLISIDKDNMAQFRNQRNYFIPDFKSDDESLTPVSLKWKMNRRTYEIHYPRLMTIEFYPFMRHCANFEFTVRQVMDDDEDDIDKSCKIVFARTIDRRFYSSWIAAAGERFEDKLKAFIAKHFTEIDKLNLIQEIRRTTIPRSMEVGSFLYAMKEGNNWTEYLPGPTKALDMIELHQAFHDAMPPSWKQSFMRSGERISKINEIDLLDYFRRLQRDAKARSNNDQNKNKKDNKNQNDNNKNKNKKGNNGGSQGGSNGKKRGTYREVGDCRKPICKEKDGVSHHDWADCHYNRNSDNYRPEKAQKLIEKNKAKNGNGKVSSAQVKIAQDTASNDNATGMMGQNDLYPHQFYGMSSCFISNADDNLVSQPGMSSSQNESNTSSSISFTSLCDDIYYSGDLDIKLIPNNLILHAETKVRPITIMSAKLIQRQDNPHPLKILFDSGSDHTMFNRRALPKGAIPKTVEGKRIMGIHGMETHNNQVFLENISLPEFSASQRVPGPIPCIVFDNAQTLYDVIIGNDLMMKLGIDIHNSTKTISWNDNTIPFRPYDYFQPNYFKAQFTSIPDLLEDDDDDIFQAHITEEQIKEAGYKSKIILPAKYEEVDPIQVAQKQSHLDTQQREQLAELLSHYKKLFSGKLGCFPTKVHIDVQEGCQPKACRPYPVSPYNAITFKEELQHLEAIGVLSKFGPSAWLSPSFIIPKKDGRVRWISDFRQLNKVIKRKVYNLPKIQDILKRRKGYRFLTKLDITMQFYTFELDEESKNLCVICTPFGNYRYNRLPMGVSQSPDIAQQHMESLFADFDDVEVYIDDVGCFSDSWEDHLKLLHRVLTILQKNNFTVNPSKCEWGIQETDWLGYWLTPNGLKPWRKRILPILALKKPKDAHDLRSFLGAINFYRDMYPRRAHILAPLSKASATKGKLQWTDEMDTAFKQIKALLAQDAFLRYPDHNKPFHIYADASDEQMGAAIFQDDAPVAYYTKKLDSAQRNYTTGEKELLSIVKVLQEFRSMLYGCPEIHVYTDHRNNVFEKFQTQRVLRWKTFLAEYGVYIQHIKGENNQLADALSRLSFDEEILHRFRPDDHSDISEDQSFYSMVNDDIDMRNCFVNLPRHTLAPFILDYKRLEAAQARDARLKMLQTKNPQSFIKQMLAQDVNIICYIPKPNEQWKLYLPDELLHETVAWYHYVLGHLGQSRLFDTISMHLYNSQLKNKVTDYVSRCDECQRKKQLQRGYGELPPRQAGMHPWRHICIDLVGPWKLQIGDTEHTFIALSIIDPVTNLAELIRLENKRPDYVALQLNNAWLSRYPRPSFCTFDQGGEFLGYGFQIELDKYGIHKSPTNAKTPTSNAICERMHQTVGNILRTMSTLNPPIALETGKLMVDTALANCIFALRASLHGGLKATPGSLVFQRDMILDIPVVGDWITIQQHREQLIDKRTITANNKRFSFDYKVGMEVLKLVPNPSKLQERAKGPYKIVEIHSNGNATIQLTPHVQERINIRRLKPYFR
jgi:RNase H-like domain found in reverse transcriptase/Reverse transcriptase (RNA-dependent DNA polymerase)/Integrase zinc binding domain